MRGLYRLLIRYSETGMFMASISFKNSPSRERQPTRTSKRSLSMAFVRYTNWRSVPPTANIVKNFRIGTRADILGSNLLSFQCHQNPAELFHLGIPGFRVHLFGNGQLRPGLSGGDKMVDCG